MVTQRLALVLACAALAAASSDPYRAGDPIHDEDFKAAYEHVDGSINEKVLSMLHHFKPVQSGALPEWAGVFLFFMVFGCSLLTYMFASGCFSVRDNFNTQRLEMERRLRNETKGHNDTGVRLKT
eukprot:CAMPEP_0173441766 /NCGR_PEP_ID=MMETSP1357-20121228/24132_1 /TAXON_ID=77926 /ORGANISM="Hemiselmis rufescens, Strain PCC563" /LENGTH=124 /DNA_ID=CAMNT_0014407365 /DNA_START=38 /DNA_END=412 /DNA_ORIENTATION=+